MPTTPHLKPLIVLLGLSTSPALGRFDVGSAGPRPANRTDWNQVLRKIAVHRSLRVRVRSSPPRGTSSATDRAQSRGSTVDLRVLLRERIRSRYDYLPKAFDEAFHQAPLDVLYAIFSKANLQNPWIMANSLMRMAHNIFSEAAPSRKWGEQERDQIERLAIAHAREYCPQLSLEQLEKQLRSLQLPNQYVLNAAAAEFAVTGIQLAEQLELQSTYSYPARMDHALSMCRFYLWYARILKSIGILDWEDRTRPHLIRHARAVDALLTSEHAKAFVQDIQGASQVIQAAREKWTAAPLLDRYRWATGLTLADITSHIQEASSLMPALMNPALLEGDDPNSSIARLEEAARGYSQTATQEWVRKMQREINAFASHPRFVSKLAQSIGEPVSTVHCLELLEQQMINHPALANMNPTQQALALIALWISSRSLVAEGFERMYGEALPMTEAQSL